MIFNVHLPIFNASKSDYRIDQIASIRNYCAPQHVCINRNRCTTLLHRPKSFLVSSTLWKVSESQQLMKKMNIRSFQFAMVLVPSTNDPTRSFFEKEEEEWGVIRQSQGRAFTQRRRWSSVQITVLCGKSHGLCWKRWVASAQSKDLIGINHWIGDLW